MRPLNPCFNVVRLTERTFMLACLTGIVLLLVLLLLPANNNAATKTPQSAESSQRSGPVSNRKANPTSNGKSLLILWWNVENLFDTVDDPATADEEFTPEGQRHWTEKKLALKRIRIDHLFQAVKANGATGRFPDIVAFAETENRQVFAKTLASVRGANYRVSYHESPDERGIDIGLAWNPSTVTFRGSKACRVTAGQRATRDIIVAGFSVAGHTFHVLLNHWPSRSFDAAWSEQYRVAAARVARHAVDSLRTNHPTSDIIVMGDFNDEPENRSLREVLGSSTSRKKVLAEPSRLLYNCWHKAREPGSYLYRGKWDRIDQVLVSAGLLDQRGLCLPDGAFRVFAFPHMIDRNGKKLFSTYEKGVYRGGYSDHLPLLLELNIR